MKDTVAFVAKIISAVITVFCALSMSWGQVIAPSGTEVKVRFSASFRASLKRDRTDPSSPWNAYTELKPFRAQRVNIRRDLPAATQALLTELADWHASHLFGLMVSPERITQEGVPGYVVEGYEYPRAGFGSVRSPTSIRVKTFKVDPLDPDFAFVEYEAKLIMLVEKSVARRWLARGHVQFPLPYDWDNTYDEHCTDHHYNTLGDYWYFWNPFQTRFCLATKYRSRA